ncbi:DUF4190 domain-containing protein [Streptomyces sp. NPDC054842]
MAIPPPPGPEQPQDAYPAPPAQGPYVHQPYQTWGQGYSPYNRPAPVNGLAIAALVLGILCFLPAVGLVLGIVALRQIKKRGERGTGMAVGGIVMSSLGVVLIALGSLGGFWEGFQDGIRDAAAEGSDITFSVGKGECFDAPGGSMEGYAYDVDRVPCTGRHDAEVFAAFTMKPGAYPGDDRITDVADTKCYALQDRYAMDAWAVPDDVDVYYFTPTRQSWRLGDREITCMFGNTDEKGSLTGSLRNDGTTLDPDQLAYLEAARVLNTAMDTAPEEEYVEDDLPGHRKWADRVSDALAEQAELLRGHTFAPGAAKPVAALADDLDAARREWAKAADAPDADAFYPHYDKGTELTDPHRTVTARKALGLDTTPPEYLEDGGGEGGGGDGDDAEV